MGRLGVRVKARKGVDAPVAEGGPATLPPPGFAGHGADPKSWRPVGEEERPSIAGRRVPSVTLSRVRTGREAGGDAGRREEGHDAGSSPRGKPPASPARPGLRKLEQGSPARVVGDGMGGMGGMGMESPGLGALGLDSVLGLAGFGDVPSFLELGGLGRQEGAGDGVDSTDVESLGSGRSNAGPGGGPSVSAVPATGTGIDDPLFNAFGGSGDWGDLRLSGETGVDALHVPYGPHELMGDQLVDPYQMSVDLSGFANPFSDPVKGADGEDVGRVGYPDHHSGFRMDDMDGSEDSIVNMVAPRDLEREYVSHHKGKHGKYAGSGGVAHHGGHEGLHVRSGGSSGHQHEGYGGDAAFCRVCGVGGDLRHCTTCTTVYHASCAVLTMAKDAHPGAREQGAEGWRCPHCTVSTHSCYGCHCVHPQGDGAAPHAPDLADAPAFVCDCCDREFHMACGEARLRREKEARADAGSEGEEETASAGGPDVPAPTMDGATSPQQDGSQGWFCSEDCRELRGELEALMNRRWPLVDEYSWEMYQHNARDKAKVALSKRVLQMMDQAFEPSADGSVSGWVEGMICAQEHDGHDYSNFRNVLLRKGREVVVVACLRMLGRDALELSLVTTRATVRGQGHFRRMLLVLTGLCRRLRVRDIIVPAADGVVPVWEHFGFRRPSPVVGAAIVNRIFMPEGCLLLMKPSSEPVDADCVMQVGASGEASTSGEVSAVPLDATDTDSAKGVDTGDDASGLELGGAGSGAPVEGARVISLGTIEVARPSFHTWRFIYPVGFKSVRTFWSPLPGAYRTCKWTSEVLDGGSAPLFKVTCEDMRGDAKVSASISGAWRSALGLLEAGGKMVGSTVSGPERFGFCDRAIAEQIEGLAGVDQLSKYSAHVSKLAENAVPLPPPGRGFGGNPSGAAPGGGEDAENTQNGSGSGSAPGMGSAAFYGMDETSAVWDYEDLLNDSGMLSGTKRKRKPSAVVLEAAKADQQVRGIRASPHGGPLIGLDVAASHADKVASEARADKGPVMNFPVPHVDEFDDMFPGIVASANALALPKASKASGAAQFRWTLGDERSAGSSGAAGKPSRSQKGAKGIALRRAELQQAVADARRGGVAEALGEAAARMVAKDDNARYAAKTSKFRGVSITSRGLYRAQICISGGVINLGTYKHEIEAAHAYDVAAIRVGRPCNFIGSEALTTNPVPGIITEGQLRGNSASGGTTRPSDDAAGVSQSPQGRRTNSRGSAGEGAQSPVAKQTPPKAQASKAKAPAPEPSPQRTRGKEAAKVAAKLGHKGKPAPKAWAKALKAKPAAAAQAKPASLRASDAPVAKRRSLTRGLAQATTRSARLEARAAPASARTLRGRP